MKQQLRRELRQRRASLEQREERSVTICHKVWGLHVVQTAHVLHCYVPLPYEVATYTLMTMALAAGKRLVVPVVVAGQADLEHSWLTSLNKDDIVDGPLHTRQPRTIVPAPLGVWDAVIVPLLGFDRTGMRLGYGGGYYDRLLAHVHCPTVGVAFAMQEVALIPSESHDQRLGWVVTEEEVFSFSQASA